MGKLLIIFNLLVNSTAFADAGYVFAPSPTGGAPAVSDTSASVTRPPSPAPSINPAANTGQQSQNSGAGANAAAAMALMAAAMPLLANPPTAPMGAALMALAALAAMQSGADKDAADQSGNTAAASNDGGGATGQNALTPYSAGSSSAAFNPIKNKAAQQALNDAGYTLTPTTMTTPTGQSSSLSSLGSSDGLSAAGLDPKAIEEAQKIAANSGNGASMSGLAVNDGAGGGAAKANAAILPDLPALKFNNPFALKPGAKAALIAGKTVNYEGEPIGVRGGDIFEMVHQAYDKRAQRGSFITSDTGKATSDRMPASVPTASKVGRSLNKTGRP